MNILCKILVIRACTGDVLLLPLKDHILMAYSKNVNISHVKYSNATIAGQIPWFSGLGIRLTGVYWYVAPWNMYWVPHSTSVLIQRCIQCQISRQFFFSGVYSVTFHVSFALKVAFHVSSFSNVHSLSHSAPVFQQ